MRRVDTIKQLVCKYFEINPMKLISQRRDLRFARPRQIAIYLVRKHSDMSSPCIGAEFGKDHSTVLAAVKRVEALIKIDEELLEDIKTIEGWLPWTNE